MSNSPSIKYFIHDGSVMSDLTSESNSGISQIFGDESCEDPRYVSADELAKVMIQAREAATKHMEDSSSDHAIYAIKRVNEKDGGAVTVDFYNPAVLMDEADEALVQNIPGCYIYALHALNQAKANYIELSKELCLAMSAGARAIENTKKYHGASYIKDVFSDKPQEIPYLRAAEVLREASELADRDTEDEESGHWILRETCGSHTEQIHCSNCGQVPKSQSCEKFCPNCGMEMAEGIFHE